MIITEVVVQGFLVPPLFCYGLVAFFSRLWT